MSDQLFAPTGAAIDYIVQTCPAWAEVDDLVRTENGIDFEFGSNGSDMKWDAQHDVEEDGERLFVDEHGQHWKESQLRTANELSVIDSNSEASYVAGQLIIDEWTAQTVIDLVTERINPRLFRPVDEWIRRCHRESPPCEKIMAALNEITEGHGVEGVHPDQEGSHGADFLYVNQGDTYTATIVYDFKADQFIMTTMGDMLEQAERDEQEEKSYRCLNCGFPWKAASAEECPYCHTNNFERTHD